jgi:hypothetical protein
MCRQQKLDMLQNKFQNWKSKSNENQVAFDVDGCAYVRASFTLHPRARTQKGPPDPEQTVKNLRHPHEKVQYFGEVSQFHLNLLIYTKSFDIRKMRVYFSHLVRNLRLRIQLRRSE